LGRPHHRNTAAPAAVSRRGGNGDAADKEEEEEEEDDDDVQEDCDGESFDAWDAEVTPRRLRWFLRFVASAWLGAGVALQVASFKEGLGDLVGRGHARLL